MNVHNNRKFSTMDRDNDRWSNNCAQSRGPFWHGDCGFASLNGKYVRNGVISWKGVVWHDWKSSWYSMKRVEMKIKPN